MEDRLYPHLRDLEDRHWWFRGRRAVIWALLERSGVRRVSKILDAGCGTGRNMEEYGKLGEIYGVDPAQQAVEFCRGRGLSNVLEAGAESLPFDDESFDLFFALDVLEHVKDDRLALLELRRVAAPGARLVITTPAYQWLWSRHDESHHHLRRYTRPVLLERATSAGWRPTFATYFNSTLLPVIAAARRLKLGENGNRTDYDATPQWIDSLLARTMQAEARLIKRGMRLPAGVSIGVLCERA